MEIGVPPSVMKTAIRTLLEAQPLHLSIFVFGVSVVILISVLAIWRHAKEGRL